MSKPPAIDLAMTRGDTYPILGAITRAGAAVDITGGTLWMTAKRAVTDDDASAVFQLDNAALGGIEFVSAVGGTYRVTVPPDATAELSGHVVLVYDVQLEDVDENVYTVARGNLTVVPDVTITTNETP